MGKAFPSLAHIRKVVAARDAYRCRYCNVTTSWRIKNAPYSRTLDHVIPVSKGGRTTVINLVIACKACNDKKGSLTLAQADMKMLPRPVYTPTQVREWAERHCHDKCRNCGRFSYAHTRPLYHGGPRDCLIGQTKYLAQGLHRHRQAAALASV